MNGENALAVVLTLTAALMLLFSVLSGRRRPLRCDRCGDVIAGFEADNFKFTAGFYDVRPESGWSYLARVKKPVKVGPPPWLMEQVLCDCCAWCDPKYVERHGVVAHEVKGRKA